METVANFDRAWKLLKDRGFTRMEMFMIRNAFAEWGEQFDNSIEHSHKHNSYNSKNPQLKSYGFGKESEVKLLHALHAVSPETKKDDLIVVLQIVLKLLNNTSEWAFNHKS